MCSSHPLWSLSVTPTTSCKETVLKEFAKVKLFRLSLFCSFQVFCFFPSRHHFTFKAARWVYHTYSFDLRHNMSHQNFVKYGHLIFDRPDMIICLFNSIWSQQHDLSMKQFQCCRGHWPCTKVGSQNQTWSRPICQPSSPPLCWLGIFFRFLIIPTFVFFTPPYWRVGHY